MSRRFGQTWWSRRWIAALEQLGAAYASRLPRGRTYARRGAVTIQTLAAGRVSAAVQGSRIRPYVVTLEIPTFDDETWAAIVTALAGQIRHAAALLDGRMPDDLDEVLADAGVSLFPGAGELRTRCTCPDWANPCKHVAATHYVLAATFDEDPFLLPTLRGRDRSALLAALREARSARVAGDERVGGDSDERVDGDGGRAGHPVRTVRTSDLPARTLYAAAGDLDALDLRPACHEDPTAPVRSLGPLPGPAEPATPAVHDAIAAGAAFAWTLLTDPSAATPGPG